MANITPLCIMDDPIMDLGQEDPTFAVAMLPTGAGGQVRVGDQVSVVN